MESPERREFAGYRTQLAIDELQSVDGITGIRSGEMIAPEMGRLVDTSQRPRVSGRIAGIPVFARGPARVGVSDRSMVNTPDTTFFKG